MKDADLSNLGLFLAFLGLTSLVGGCDSDTSGAEAQPQEGTQAPEEHGGGQTSVRGESGGAAQQPTKNRTSERSGPLQLGEAAPMTDRSMKNVDEREVTIASVAGEHGTLVIFTCNHCPWAQAWESRITTLGNTYRERGVGVIAINANDPSEYPEDAFAPMQERARAAGMTFPYVVDDTSEVARAFGAQKTPEAFLFDSGGRLVYQGAIDDNAHEPDEVEEHYLRDALQALISGEPVSHPQTRAMGCSIKLRPS